jgi:UDP-N-acetylmuramate: L-alanyl-gamma-D-glutamyl-meso-diaminopimelate ligase
MDSSIKRVHFIAIGGAIMHNLALALHKKGLEVSGSDDEIYDPAKSRLANAGILPTESGWFPEKITKDLDAIILGMHARIDNPN